MPGRTGRKSGLTRGRTRRVAKVGGLATSVGGRYLWEAVRWPFRSVDRRRQSMLDAHIRNAMRIVESSQELKGAFMKLVQMLSMRDDVLPAEALQVLSVVQSKVPPMDYREIREQVRRELGKPPEELFAHFEHEAFAAASLGQVHAAVLPGGEQVVVKVQYPGVDETVEQDLRNIKALLHTFTLIGRDVLRQKIDQSEVYRELEERLFEELDYLNEAKNIELFGKLFRDDPEVEIPRVYRRYCSRRVLTMSRLEGYPLGDILAPGVDRELKDWVAVKYYQVLWRQVFEFGVLHTDPHPGNYLVTYHPKLAILDFGSVRVFPDEIREAYLELAEAMLARDRERIADCCVRLGYIDPEDDREAMVRIMEIVFEPVLTDREYDPREYDSLKRAMEIASIGIEHRIFKAPGHRVFLSRALMGLDAYLKQLGTVANWHRLFRQAVEDARRRKRR